MQSFDKYKIDINFYFHTIFLDFKLSPPDMNPGPSLKHGMHEWPV